MSQILFHKVLEDIQSQLNLDVQTLAQEEDTSTLIKNSIEKFISEEKFFSHLPNEIPNPLPHQEIKQNSREPNKHEYEKKHKTPNEYEEKHTEINKILREPVQGPIQSSVQDSTTLKEWARKRVYNELMEYGPIQPLLQLEGINEILINSPKSIWYEWRGEMFQLKDQFYSKISFENFIHRICFESKIKLDLAEPTQDTQWKQFRLHIIRPPLTPSPCLSLRAHPTQPWTFQKLRENHWSNSQGFLVMEELLKSKKSFLLIGPTGSGKTSVLNSCLKQLKQKERCLILEDTNEISPPNEISVKLLTRTNLNHGLKNYSLSDLVRQSLRMRPDRIIIGEMRGEEAKDFLMALSTGHGGGMSTLHAENPHQALLRLEMLIQLGAPQWNLHSIRSLIHLGLSHIISLNKNRTLQSIHKISSLETNGLLLENILER